MGMFSLLKYFRLYHQLEFQEVANELCISKEYYQLLEEGQIIVDSLIADKLSQFYKAPIGKLLKTNTADHCSINFSHCYFANCINGQISYVNQDEKITEMICNEKDRQILLLKEEIQRLRVQNKTIIEMLIIKAFN